MYVNRVLAAWIWYGLVGVLIAFFAWHRAELIELFKTSSLITGALFASIVPPAMLTLAAQASPTRTPHMPRTMMRMVAVLTVLGRSC
jgi:hypothetical protein